VTLVYYILARSRQANKRVTTLHTKLLATSIYTIFIFLSYPNEPDISSVKNKKASPHCPSILLNIPLNISEKICSFWWRTHKFSTETYWNWQKFPKGNTAVYLIKGWLTGNHHQEVVLAIKIKSKPFPQMTELLAIFLVCKTAAGLPVILCGNRGQQCSQLRNKKQEVTDFSTPKNPKGKLAGLER